MESGKGDLLAASQVLNLSDKTVVAIRTGWVVKELNEPDDERLNGWTSLTGGLQPEDTASVPAQKIDSTVFKKPGTIIWVYIASVRFEDGSTWQRKLQPKSQPNQTMSLLSTPRFDFGSS